MYMKSYILYQFQIQDREMTENTRFQMAKNDYFQNFFEQFSIYTVLKKENKQLPKQDSLTSQIKVKKAISFECHIVKQSYDILQTLEMKEHIIYAFVKNDKIKSKITVYSFAKEDGTQQKISILQFDHYISTLKFHLFQITNQNNHEKSIKDITFPHYKLVIGFQNGNLGVLDLAKGSKISYLKLETKSIVSIVACDYDLCSQINICFVLLMDSSIFAVDLNRMRIVYMLKPNIVMGDNALSIEINRENSFLMQTTRGGYMIFWKLQQFYKDINEISIGNQKSTKRHFSVFPFVINHTICIDGFLYCKLYGNCILFVDRTGLLKVIMLNLKNQGQYIVLSSYKIQNHLEASSFCFFQIHKALFVSSLQSDKPYIQKIYLNQSFEVYQTKRIYISNMDAILEFSLCEGIPIVMCRGFKCISVGFQEQFFQEAYTESNENQQQNKGPQKLQEN